MNHIDGEMSEVVVVVDALHDHQIEAVADKLKAAGLEVFKIDRDEGLIDGTVPTDKLASLGAVEHVRYVRNVLTYTVDYPPGDARDQDGADGDD